MSCSAHQHHDHVHGKDCGHTAIKHGDHIDYLHDGHLHHEHDGHLHHEHDGHLHHEHDGHYDEHRLEVNEQNPDGCIPTDCCAGHIHGEGCGHEAVPHGDHIDYIVNGRLHHQHGDHCDDHGAVEIVK